MSLKTPGKRIEEDSNNSDFKEANTIKKVPLARGIFFNLWLNWIEDKEEIAL